MLEYMNYFVVILLLGIILAGLLLLLVVAMGTQKRKQIQELNSAGEKLEKILSESETMIDELNKFSDYVVSMMEEKNSQLKETSKYAEDIINRLMESADGRILERTGSNEPVNEPVLGKVKGIAGDKLQKVTVKKDNVVPMNPKHREILELAEYGLSDTDIAKSLQMGKGEVQLILGMKKG